MAGRIYLLSLSGKGGRSGVSQPRRVKSAQLQATTLHSSCAPLPTITAHTPHLPQRGDIAGDILCSARLSGSIESVRKPSQSMDCALCG